MAKYEEVSARTRQNLMDAFWELYCEKPIEKITVRAVTEKAGYSRGTFYEYFSDTYDVLEQIEESLLPTREDMPPILPGNAQPPFPVDSFFDFYSRSGKYYAVLLGEKGDPAFAEKIKKRIRSALMEQSPADPAEMLEIDYILEAILSAMIGVLTYWFKRRQDIPREDLVALMYRSIDTGMLQRLAEKLLQ